MDTKTLWRSSFWMFLYCCSCLGEVRVPILLFDYAGVSAGILGDAKATATRILGEAGVQPEWVDCDAIQGCANPPRALQLRIIPKEMAKHAASSKHCLGYALVTNGSGSIASAFYHKALDLEGENVAGAGSILGAILAHEIGHLLMGDNRHSDHGIMRPVWENQDLKSIARGRLLFTREQAERILANAARRWN